MTKILFIFVILITLSTNISGQETYWGKYYNFFNAELTLNPDSSYFFVHENSKSSSWSSGQWKVNDDTILLYNLPVYDHLKYYDQEKKKEFDLLILSDDTTSEDITRNIALGYELQNNGQNRIAHPLKLCLKKGKLYEIQSDGRINDKKIFCPGDRKKLNPIL